MLILSRQQGKEYHDTILIGPDIRIVVKGVERPSGGELRGARVKIGIIAPREVSVLRAELVEGTDAERG